MVSLENEYFNEKQLLENAQERLNKIESLDVEKMTKEQLEARDRVIKRAKEEIEECEELLEEIKEELVEFINNGGDVSEKTMTELEEVSSISTFEPFDVDFKVVSNKNPNIYVKGYVTINGEEDEDIDWYFYNGQGFITRYMFIEHEGVDGFKGATEEQKWEVEEFRQNYGKDSFWIDTCIAQSEEYENRTYVRKDVTLIINEGAKMELVCKTNYDPNDFSFGDRNFYALMSFKFNGETIEWDKDLLTELADEIDSTYAGEDRYKIIDNQTIEIEIYDGYDNDLEEYVGLSGHNEESRELIEDHLNDAKNIYKQQLTRNIGVYGIAAGIYEEKYGKLNEGDRDKFANNWEQYFEDYDIGELFILSSEYVEKFIKEELNRDDY